MSKLTYLNDSAKAALPTSWEPKVMQRTSAVGHCTAAHAAARVITDPAPQKATQAMRLGLASPAFTVVT